MPHFLSWDPIELWCTLEIQWALKKLELLRVAWGDYALLTFACTVYNSMGHAKARRCATSFMLSLKSFLHFLPYGNTYHTPIMLKSCKNTSFSLPLTSAPKSTYSKCFVDANIGIVDAKKKNKNKNKKQKNKTKNKKTLLYSQSKTRNSQR